MQTDQRVISLLEKQTDLLEQLTHGQNRQTRRLALEIGQQVRLVRLGLAWLIFGAAMAYPTVSGWVGQAKQTVETTVNCAKDPLGCVQGKYNPADPIFTQKPQIGDQVGDWLITSDYGERVAPVPGASTFHRGVDVGMDEGTALYSIGNSTVTCDNQPDGAGVFATLKSDVGKTFVYMHMSECNEGTYRDGQAVGKVGNTGISSAPHLHFGQKDGDGTGDYVEPGLGYVIWAVTGKAPGKPPEADPLTAKTGLGGIDDFASRIVAKESSGDPSVVNEIGAMGLYQFMPDTLDGLSQSCFGRMVPHDEFLGNVDLQHQAAKCYWQQEWSVITAATSDPVQQCRMLASYHYSGRSDLWDDTSPQSTHVGSYPSIADYTAAICK